MNLNIYIYAYKGKLQIENDLITVLKHFIDAHFTIYAEPWICKLVFQKFGIICSSDAGKCGLVISVGGDGTLLRAAKLSVKYNIPLLGLNTGRVGFLTEADAGNAEQIIEKLKNNDYFIEYRDLLSVNNNPVVNDVVISRGSNPRLIEFEVYCETQFMCKYFADGIIVSTPTGSTGYTLSVGGPIMMPDLNCTIVTPICAHSLMNRPFVISNNKDIHIHLKNDFQANCQLIQDGEVMKELFEDEIVYITNSEQKLQLLRFEKKNFFDVVQTKLSEWR